MKSFNTTPMVLNILKCIYYFINYIGDIIINDSHQEKTKKKHKNNQLLSDTDYDSESFSDKESLK